METIVERNKGNDFEWIDLRRPSADDLMGVMERYDLHKTAILDSLDPHHLPKLERFKNGVFLIVRMHDRAAPEAEDNLQKLTRKVSIYLNAETLITIRRDGDNPLDDLVTRWKHKSRLGGLDTPVHPLNEILEAVVGSYLGPLERSQNRLDELEKNSFSNASFKIVDAESAYGLIAKSSVIKRILSLTLHIIDRIGYIPEASRPFYNDVKEDIESLLFWAQDIHEGTSRILQLQISLEAQRTNEASQKTNEIMRILTVFSVFFMPLNLIASIYGMNFSNFPLQNHPFGFWLSLVSMGLSGLMIFVWFRTQGWLRPFSRWDMNPPLTQPIRSLYSLWTRFRKLSGKRRVKRRIVRESLPRGLFRLEPKLRTFKRRRSQKVVSI